LWDWQKKKKNPSPKGGGGFSKKKNNPGKKNKETTKVEHQTPKGSPRDNQSVAQGTGPRGGLNREPMTHRVVFFHQVQKKGLGFVVFGEKKKKKQWGGGAGPRQWGKLKTEKKNLKKKTPPLFLED